MYSNSYNRKHPILLLLIVTMIFSACEKIRPIIFKNGGLPKNNVFVAGYESNGTVNVAKYWIDGREEILSDGINNAVANSVFVSGIDVYIAGTDNGTAVYWKNNKEVKLSPGKASSIFVSGGDVYVGGSDTSLNAVYWINGTEITLSNKVSSVYSIFISGTDVFAAGYDDLNAVYWKNGTEITLMEGNSAASLFWANSIYVSGNDVHVVGSSREAGNAFPTLYYWKNGVRIPVHTQDNYGPGNSIFVSGTDVYIAGMNESGPPYVSTAAYWKNENLNLLSGSETTSFANSIFVFGSHVYVAGYEESDVKYAVYWKDSVETILTDGSHDANASSVFVK